jgi:hypothetical protein
MNAKLTARRPRDGGSRRTRKSATPKPAVPTLARRPNQAATGSISKPQDVSGTDGATSHATGISQQYTARMVATQKYARLMLLPLESTGPERDR